MLRNPSTATSRYDSAKRAWQSTLALLIFGMGQFVVLSNEGNDQGLLRAGTGGAVSGIGEPTALIHSASTGAGGASGSSVPGDKSVFNLDGAIPPYVLTIGLRSAHRALLRQAAHAALTSLSGLPITDGVSCQVRMRSRCAMMARNFGPTFLPHTPLNSLLQQWVC